MFINKIFIKRRSYSTHTHRTIEIFDNNNYRSYLLVVGFGPLGTSCIAASNCCNVLLLE